MTMDRRSALKRLAAGATYVGGSLVVSRPAFADGGSPLSCRPSPNTSTSLAVSITGSKKDWASVTPGTTTFSHPGCPCGTASVQFRWELSAPIGMALYDAATGGNQVSTGFASTLTSPVYFRNTTGGNLASGVYTARLVVRYVCTDAGNVYWSCQSYLVTFTYVQGGGSDGTLSGVSTATVGPPDDSSSCDSPAP